MQEAYMSYLIRHFICVEADRYFRCSISGKRYTWNGNGRLYTGAVTIERVNFCSVFPFVSLLLSHDRVFESKCFYREKSSFSNSNDT